MSVLYDIHERLCVENLPDNNDEINTVLLTMRRQITLLCAQLLCNDKETSNIRKIKLNIKADGKTTKFYWDWKSASNILSADIQVAIHGIPKAKNLLIDLDYVYEWHYNDDYLSIGPFVMTELLDECDNAIFENIDYVMFNTADCGEGAGIILVYGKRNGVLHKGALEYTIVDKLPSFGIWDEQRSEIVIENDNEIVPDENIPRVTELCHSLIKMDQGGGSESNFSIEQNFLYLNLDFVYLDTPEKLVEFTSYLSELASLLSTPPNMPPETFFIGAEFYDKSETGPNLLKIETTYNGEVKIYAAFPLDDRYFLEAKS